MPESQRIDPATASPARSILLFLIGDLLLILAYAYSLAAGWWKHSGGIAWKLSTLLDAAGVGSLASWFLGCQLFLVAYLIGLYVLGEISRARRRMTWLLVCLPLPFAALSFDAVADLHTWVSSLVPRLFQPGLLYPGSFSSQNLYTLSMATFLVAAAGFAFLFHPSRRTFLPVLLRFSGALAIFLAGTLTLEGHLRWGVSHALSLELESVVGALARLLGATSLLWAAHSPLGSSDTLLPGVAPTPH